MDVTENGKEYSMAYVSQLELVSIKDDQAQHVGELYILLGTTMEKVSGSSLTNDFYVSQL